MLDISPVVSLIYQNKFFVIFGLAVHSSTRVMSDVAEYLTSFIENFKL